MRSPNKLAKNLAKHPNVTVIVGEITDGRTLAKAVKNGITSVVLLVGGGAWTRGTVC